MRTQTCAALISLLTPLILEAQVPQSRARADSAFMRADLLALGADTFDVRVVRRGTVGDVVLLRVVHELRQGTDADRGAIVDVSSLEVLDGDGEPVSRTIDTTLVGAADLRFRRAHVVRVDQSGTPRTDDVIMVDGATIIRTLGTPERDSVRRTSFDAGAGAPYALPLVTMRAAPLAIGWRATLPMYLPGSAESLRLVVDSVGLLTASGRRAWRVHAHADTTIRFTFTVDSVTRDMIAFTAERENGATIVTNTNRRYRVANAVARSSADTGLSSPAARAIAGHYVLEGMREVGSELLLRPDGQFQFMLVYGALDETGEGTWTRDGAAVILQSAGVPHPPTVRLQGADGVAVDSMTILVLDPAGEPLSGVSLDLSRNSAAPVRSQTTRNGYTLHFTRDMPPTLLGISVEMLKFRVPFALTAPVKATYRFVVDRGDMGTRRFEAKRLRVDEGRLTMTINGERLTYVRH